jgi:hypothetical protein
MAPDHEKIKNIGVELLARPITFFGGVEIVAQFFI